MLLEVYGGEIDLGLDQLDPYDRHMLEKAERKEKITIKDIRMDPSVYYQYK